MPELPEVQTIVTDLKGHVENAVILDIVIEKNYNVFPDKKIFEKEITNKKIISVTRIAKNIVLGLEDNNFLVFHLAMTGRLLLRVLNFKKDNWSRVVLVLEKNGKKGELRFTDMRMFGKVKLLNKDEVKELERKYGFDPTLHNTSPEEFLEILRSRRTNIKNALLDQKLISGIGNIYATDSLWMSEIHPETKTSNINLKAATVLLKNIKEILEESIQHRGSTLEDKMYVDIFGKPGNHQEHFRIYGKRECPKCNQRVSFKKLNGRGTYFCTNCQMVDQ